ncbi:MAG: DUF1566 domain-containing protein [Leptonema sp. (in: bacteria)]
MIKNFLSSFVLFLLVVNCTQKKEDSSAALLSLSNFVNNGNGTVTDSSGKTWMKCTYGQVWDSTTDLCIGTGGGTTYGAKSLAACTIEGLCYDTATLQLNDGPAFAACDELSFADYTDWRVPTKYELGALAQTLVNRDTFLLTFPNTPDDKFFWTSSISETDQKLAYSINLSNTDFGKEFTRTTTTVQYVRCVRP